MEPYALHLLHRFMAGETIDQLAAREGIPLDRIILRLHAAVEYQRRRNARLGEMARESMESLAA